MTGVSRNFSTSAKATISSNLLPDLGAAHAEDGAVEIDVLAAGELGMKAGADLQQARHPAADRHRPSVGSVIRDRIFSSVDLPAPLRPMMPTTSPRLISKVTSLQRPELLDLVAGDDRPAAHHVAAPSGASCCADRAITSRKRRIALALAPDGR